MWNKGRSINDHLQILTNLVEILNDPITKRPGMALVAVDQGKAFDGLEHKYLYTTLKALNFGTRFIRSSENTIS